ncbi:MAG: hypothetical protein GQ574_21050 [Crocinitomix sp.]|nr:hypothetical protein [Crocinitomix sp.]
MESESDEKIVVDFKKFKGHHRKFPWTLIIRVIVALVSIAIIFFLVQFLDERLKEQPTEKRDIEIEVEF